jgi:isopentenyl-diphosphate Delta-isomerase
MSKPEYVTLVDENNVEQGREKKLAAHQQALCHRAFSVFVFRPSAQGLDVLMQQRHPDKYHCGGLWTNTCCGHPRPGEKTQQAATRRLAEELGLKMTLHYVDRFHYIAHFDNGLTENEVDHVFWSTYAGENICLHPEEISTVSWQSVPALQQQIRDFPERFTPWLSQALTIALKKENNTCEY